MDRLHTQGILRGQRSHRSHAITTQCRKCFQVRLDTCTAAAVRPCNAQHSGILVSEWNVFHGLHYQQTFTRSVLRMRKIDG